VKVIEDCEDFGFFEDKLNLDSLGKNLGGNRVDLNWIRIRGVG